MGFFTKFKKKVSSSFAAKAVAGAAIVMLLGGGTAGLAYAGGLTGAKTAVGVAFINTFVTDAGKLISDVQEQGGELLVEFSGQEISLDSLGIGGGMTFPNTTFRLLARSNPEQEVNASLDFLVADNVLLSANAYVNRELWQVTVPKLFSTVLTAEHYAEDAIKDFVSDGVPKDLLEKLCKAYEEYLADTEIEKGKREELRINGVRYNCRIYQTNLPADNINGFIAAARKELSSYGVELGNVPAFADDVSLTFHICKERMISISAEWTTQKSANGEMVDRPGNIKLISGQNGKFSLDVEAEEKEWSVKGYLKTSPNNIAPLTGKQLNIFAMTKEEEAGLKAEISRNITRLMFRWMGLLR